MPSIQDFRNMVGQYSEGYLSMTNDASGNQQLSKVANHRTLTFLNPSEAKVRAQLGGAAAQEIRQALAEALRGESQTILEHPAVRKILFGDTEAAQNPQFSPKPLSRREVRQVFEILDLQKLFAKSGVTVAKGDLTCAEGALFRAKSCTSAYVKALSLLMPPPEPGMRPRAYLTPELCARIAEKAVDLHKAFLGKPDEQITNNLLWKTVFDESMPEGALQDDMGRDIPLAMAMENRLLKMFDDAVGKEIQGDERSRRAASARASYTVMGLTLSGALKSVMHPEKITGADIAPGCPAFPKCYSRSETIAQMVKDIPRARNLTFSVLHQVRDRPDAIQEFKIGGTVSAEECKVFCAGLDSEIQQVYSNRLLEKNQSATVIPEAQLNAILMFCRQDADDLLVYPGTTGLQDKNILVKVNKDSSVDVLVNCRVCGNDGHPGSAAVCRVYADGQTRLLDLVLARDFTQMVGDFIGI